MIAQVNSDKLKELEKLVESIKKGERVVFLPPGISNFIAVNMLLIFSFITLFAPLVSILGSDWDIGVKATAQFLIVLLVVGCIVPPALLITRGRKSLQRWFVVLSSTLAFSAAVLVVYGIFMNVQSIQNQSAPLYACIIISSLASFLVQSTRYQILIHFYYLIHFKR